MSVRTTKLALAKYREALKLARAKKPQPGKTFKLLSEAEALGHGEATYALATWHLFGTHVAANPRKAVTLLKRASRRGSADAAFDLAIAFETGKFVPQNTRKAFELYLVAALRYRHAGELETMYSFREAAYEVARCYDHGIGIAVDRALSRIWMKEGRAIR